MTQPNDLPPLPETAHCECEIVDGVATFYRLWTAEHMTAYGHQCAEAAVERERARCVAICGEVMREELERRQHYASSVAGVCGLRISNPSFQIK